MPQQKLLEKVKHGIGKLLGVIGNWLQNKTEGIGYALRGKDQAVCSRVPRTGFCPGTSTVFDIHE